MYLHSLNYDLTLETIIKMANFKFNLNDKNFQFGLFFSLIFFVFFLFQLLIRSSVYLDFLIISLVFFFASIFKPEIFYYPTKIWIKIGFWLGSLTTPIILTLLYIITILPISFLLKIFNYDILSKKFNDLPSYWNIRKQKLSNFKDQF